MKTNVVSVQEHRELSTLECRTLAACEEDINKGGELIATALHVIRDQRLYRAEFDTFEEYCRERIGKGRSWVNRQIMHIEVIANITETMSQDGQEDRQDLVQACTKLSAVAARVIADLSAAQQAQVVASVVDAGKSPTAAALKTARQELFPAPVKTPPPPAETANEQPPETTQDSTDDPEAAADPQEKFDSATHVLDVLGRPVPPHLVAAMATAAEISALRNLVSKVRQELNRLRKLPGGELLEQSIANLEPFDHMLKVNRFATTCPLCEGTGCHSCRNMGWLQYNRQLNERQIQLLAEFDISKIQGK